MKTTHVRWACLAALLAASPLLVTECGGTSAAVSSNKGTSSGASSGGESGGGEDSGTTTPEQDGESTSTGSDGSGSSSGATGGDAGTSSDAASGSSSSSGGTAIPVPEGGAPSTPGMIACGSATCDTSSSQCCVAADGGASCIAYNASCPGGVTKQCAEASDCANGVCCQELVCGPHPSTCMSSCSATATGGLYFQLCRTDSECGTTSDAGAAKQCIVQTCGTMTTMTGTCGGTTTTVEACAYPVMTANGLGGYTTTWGPLPECTAN